ncbi:ACD_00520 [African swine fever virus]
MFFRQISWRENIFLL